MKKIICLLLAFSLVFTLCACGKDSTSDADDNQKEQSDVEDNKKEQSDVEDKKDNENIKTEDISYIVGEYLFFGSYEQDNDISNGKEDIEWLILDIQDGKALVISKYALDAQPYNTEEIPVTWETCTLRQWLNDNFINSAFSADEQKKIQTTTVVAEDNKHFNTEAGNDTQDKIFLLSFSEALNYFDSNEARESTPTEYAVAEGCWTSYGYCWSWLRTPGEYQKDAVSEFRGDVDSYGGDVDKHGYAVRPVMWIELG